MRLFDSFTTTHWTGRSENGNPDLFGYMCRRVLYVLWCRFRARSMALLSRQKGKTDETTALRSPVVLRGAVMDPLRSHPKGDSDERYEHPRSAVVVVRWTSLVGRDLDRHRRDTPRCRHLGCDKGVATSSEYPTRQQDEESVDRVHRAVVPGSGHSHSLCEQTPRNRRRSEITLHPRHPKKTMTPDLRSRKSKWHAPHAPATLLLLFNRAY